MTNPWSPDFSPPPVLDTESIHLEPIGGQHAAIDYIATMDSFEHLKATMHFDQYFQEKPYTIDENREALRGHWQQYLNGEGYTYTVLKIDDREACIGCVYLYPLVGSDYSERSVELTYWVVRQVLESDFDRHLLETMLNWLEGSWPFDVVRLPLRDADERCLRHADEWGLHRLNDRDHEGRIVFEWCRS